MKSINRAAAYFAATAAGMAVAFGAAFAASGAALAAATEPKPICSTWQARGTTGAYPNIVFGTKPAGTEITSTTAKLVKPIEGESPGVEFATYDLDVALTSATLVQVAYKLSADASPESGAVRLFGYAKKNADTINDAPDWTTFAGGDEGDLVLNIEAGKTIGTLGLVYDASNPAKGSVTFSEMVIGGRKVSFTACPKPTPTATVTPTATASPTVLPTATRSTSPAPDRAPTLPPVNGQPSLPVTGVSLPLIAGGGLALLVLGAGAYFIARRRKVEFTS